MKQRVEFYQSVLKPAPNSASMGLLCRVSLAIVVAWALIFASAMVSQYQLTQQNIVLQAAVQAAERDAALMSVALSDLKARQDNGELERVEFDIQTRQQLLQLLNQTNLVSYAKTLNDLAHIPWQGVALQGLTLQGNQMVLRGAASQASAVPAWILGFEKSSSLRGHSFGRLAINQAPEGGLSFSLTSSEVTP
ncbi:PilN domain-containing protein [Oceanisphaera sp. IT1-181]|uniref:PilN domain-containing protein n=1 Tax=Oceanisphaera sp. IT1-181 TaxID=3081199 RepID=UPI0029CAA635|nr:fimbrial assembly protein [Oceanisphaera sp. IT1-181]